MVRVEIPAHHDRAASALHDAPHGVHDWTFGLLRLTWL
jgi:hypothetical protein